MVYRDANGKAGSLDFREKAPLKAHRDMYLDENGNVIKNLSLKGAMAVGVPGSVDGMYTLWKNKGKLDWKKLVQPAIDLAKNGVVLTQAEADKLNDYREVLIEVNGSSIPLVNAERTWLKGDRILYPELAKTLQRIQKSGRDGFYKGKTAEILLETIQQNGGIISQQDLDKYQSVWREVISAPYRGYKILSMPPPSSGGIALAQLFMGSEEKGLHQYAHNSEESIHLMTELQRRVYADRATHLGDPDFYDVPVEMLLNPTYNKERNAGIDMNQKTDSQEIKSGKVERIESFETTHFSIVDPQGNAVSITTTLNGNYGSKLFVKQGGFLLNNEMDDFSSKPGIPNQFGLVGAEANAIIAEKRMLSSMTPTIVEKDGELFMVVGTPGGSTIITSVYQTILNVIDHGMTMQEAVNAKKTHSQWLPDRIVLEENAFPKEVIEGLKAKGHQIKFIKQLGKMDAVLVNENGTLEGASDITRTDGVAIGF